MKWTEEDLLEQFCRLNHRYFGNRLSVLYVRFEGIEMPHAIGHTKAYRDLRGKHPDTFGIRISPRIQDMRAIWLGTLIHEMVHVEQRNRYSCRTTNGNSRFNRRMKELAAAGAFNGVW